MWSNYYLYYHLWEKRFYLLTWDQNLAFNWMWWGWGPWGMGWFPGWNMFSGAQMPSLGDTQDSSAMPQNDNSENSGFPDFEWFDFGSWDMPTPPDFEWWFPWWDFPWWWENWDRKWPGLNWNNLLKTRLLANEKFKAMYDEIYTKIEEIALNSDFSENFFNEWSNAFYKYNSSKELVTESAYSQWVEKLKSYLENKKS